MSKTLADYALMKAPENRIDKVGPELEGGWTCHCDARFMATRGDMVVHRDGTVSSDRYSYDTGQASNTVTCRCQPSRLRHDGSVGVTADWVGEISPDHGLPLKDVVGWMKTYYPQAINTSCGMHVHISLKDYGDYTRLMTPEFEGFLMDQLAAWGKAYKVPPRHAFWHRLLGLNRYCQRGITDSIIQRQRSATRRIDDRYYALNFCYGLHGTMEVRVLPMFKDVNTAIRALLAVTRGVNRYLAYVRQADRKPLHITERVTVPADNAPVAMSSAETTDVAAHWMQYYPGLTVDAQAVFHASVAIHRPDSGCASPTELRSVRSVRRNEAVMRNDLTPGVQPLSELAIAALAAAPENEWATPDMVYTVAPVTGRRILLRRATTQQ